MAEFCVECWNELNGTKYSESDFILSEDLDLCEGCGELKKVIISEREFTFSALIKDFISFIKNKVSK